MEHGFLSVFDLCSIRGSKKWRHGQVCDNRIIPGRRPPVRCVFVSVCIRSRLTARGSPSSMAGDREATPSLEQERQRIQRRTPCRSDCSLRHSLRSPCLRPQYTPRCRRRRHPDDDFEAADYGLWKVEGTAFGPGPAKGTLPGQMEVSGYKGERPSIPLWRRQVHRQAHVARVHHRKELHQVPHRRRGLQGQDLHEPADRRRVVLSATGPNIVPGGSEFLKLGELGR